jgi:hemerythrin-like metal-binding protein
MSIGNRMIDSAHRELLGLVGSICDSISAKDCPAISENFRLLEERLLSYFSIEEKIALKVSFPFASHDASHRNMLEQFRHARDELGALNGLWSDIAGEAHGRVIMNYLIKHITEESAQIKVILDTFLYDLKPD